MAIKFQWPWRVEKPIDPRVVAQQVMAETLRGLIQQAPAQSAQVGWPSALTAPEVSAYRWDFPWQYTTPQSPRQQPGKVLDIGAIRQLAEIYDPLRSCILHLKREVRATPIKVQPRDPKAKISAAALSEASAWFTFRGGIGGLGRPRSEFEDALFEDLLVVGATAIYHHKARSGAPYSDIAIDAATIRPRVSAFGWTDPEFAFEQWVQGMQVARFASDELTYRGLHCKTYSPYYTSPVEWLLTAIMSGIKADEWNLSWLTDGTTVSDIMALPETWTPDQVQAWWVMWDAMNAGNARSRAGKTKFVPGGTQRVSSAARKDQDFETFQLWLMRRTCSIMGVQPASIGFAGEQYKVSQEGSMEQTSAFGVGALLDYRKEHYDDALIRLGYEDLEVANLTAKEEKASERATRLQVATGGSWKTINEARKEDGLDPIEGGDELRMMPGSAPDPMEEPSPRQKPSEKKIAADAKKRAFGQWERKALARVRAGKSAICSFVDDNISAEDIAAVAGRLAGCGDAESVRAVFAAQLHAGSVAARLNG